MRIRPIGVAALMGAAIAISCSGGAPTGEAEPSASSPVAPPPSPGHQRMAQLLQQVAADARVDNPYLGVGRIDQLDAELAAVPEGVPDLRRWLFHKLLGRNHLRVGNNERAIEHYLEAYRQLEVFAGEIPEEEALKTIYGLGVAYMRKGETDNCALRHTAESCIFPIRGTGVHTVTDGSESAIPRFIEVLQRSERGSWMYLKSQWMLNLAYMTLGRWPDDVPPPYGIAPEAFASDEPFPRFHNIAPRLGMDRFDLAGGAIIDDFDGDALLDVLVSSSDVFGPMHFYRNKGDGTFHESAEAAGLGGMVGGLNMNHADYDNDGDPDVLVLRGAWWRQFGLHPNSLLRNNGDGTFEDVTFAAGLAEPAYPTQNAAWADYDNDGDVDLFVGNEYDPFTLASSQLYRNNGDGTFTDVAAEAGVTNDRYAKGSSWGDYDNDGWPDLYVSNMSHLNRLYHNNGDGTFTDVAEQAGVTRPVASFGAWFWDYNNDGALDIYVNAYGGRRLPPDLGSVAASYLGLPHRAELARLYRGDGKGGFTDVTETSNVDLVTLPMGANFGDIDNDGWLDFYLGTGYPYYEALTPNVLYRNREGRDFADVTTAGGVGHLQKGHGVVFADLDNDGDQDLFEQVGGQYPGDAYNNALWENPGFDRHWTKLKLIGETSNRAGIGARIKIEVNDGGVSRTIHRHVTSGGSFGANPYRLEIGLGAAERIDLLEIHWPTSGTTRRFEDVVVDHVLEIPEGEGDRRAVPLQRIDLGS
jgi:hypothetical protein